MNKILLSCLLFALAAGIAYRWQLYYAAEEAEDAFGALRIIPTDRAAMKASRIRQLHSALDDYRSYLPVGASDVQIQRYSSVIWPYADVMTKSSLDRAIAMVLSERREGAHQYGVRLYMRILDVIESKNSVIRDGCEVSQIYKDCIWLARCHGSGLSFGIGVDDVLRMFDQGQAYCLENRKEDVSWFTFERAIFLSKYADHEKSIQALRDGLKHLGYNDDRDGSVLHEYGMALMRKSHRDKNPELLLEAVDAFDKAIAAKHRAGISMTPLYSKKMKCEALSEYYFTKKMRAEFLALKKAHLDLADEWERSLTTLDSGGLKALPQVYLSCAMCLIFNRDKETAVVYLRKCKSALVKYDPDNAEELKDVDAMLGKLEAELIIK